ncbi:MAG: hypothetical protein KAX16_03375 [Actinomycetia bacterium]|nr:hypothetical protein [Actinomycetes bacterium]
MKQMEMKYSPHRLVRAILIGLVVLGLLTSGCTAVRRVDRKIKKDVRTIGLKGAESVRAEIIMGTGKLSVSGGVARLLEAKFAYDIGRWKPEVDYDVRGDTGILSIRQPSEVAIFISGIRYEWDIRLNDKVPLELSIDLGLGDSDLSLGSLNLDELDISAGAGNTRLDLVGKLNHDVDVNVDQGLGNLELRLPKDSGVRVDIDKGLGNIKASGFKMDGDYYVNDAYADSGETLNIEIEQGAGNITLKVVDQKL